VETIGGYRIIRKLGSGERSDVYLGHAAPTEGRAAGQGAIKLFRPRVSEVSVNAEINALSRLRHAHIVGLLDLATGPQDGPCLVLQRLGPRALPALLAGRRLLQAGEAVTILAPLVAAVATMHGNGVSHGAISARKVQFDDAGAPVLAGFGAATCFAELGVELSEAALDSEPLVLGDRLALVKLVTSVVGRSTGSAESVQEFSRWLTSLSNGEVRLSELEQRIFGMAEPLAVQFPDHDSPIRADHPVPTRMVLPGRQADVAPPVPSQLERPTADLLSVLPPEIANWVSARLASAPEWAGTLIRALRDHLLSVRRGVWVVAAVGVTALVTAMGLANLPSTNDSSESELRTESPPPAVSQAIAGDDPVAAVDELLALRAGCLADRSILCLDSVHAADSAAWLADAEKIRAAQDGGELSPNAFLPGSTATLVDRLGQTALVELVQHAESPTTRTTASVLMLRTEAGWRFRSLGAESVPVDGAVP